MALRISSAEIVNSAMGGVLFPAGSGLGWIGRWGRSAGEPAPGGFESVGDAAVDDLVAHADDQATEDGRVDGHLQSDLPAVEAAEHVAQPLLLVRGERGGGGDPGDRLTAATAGHLGQPLDGDVSTANVGGAEDVPQQLLGARADLAGQQPVQERVLAVGGGPPVAQDPGELPVAGDDAAEAEELVLDSV